MQELEQREPGGCGDQLGLLESGLRMSGRGDAQEGQLQEMVQRERIHRIWGQNACGVEGREIKDDSQVCTLGSEVEVAPFNGIENPGGAANLDRLQGTVHLAGELRRKFEANSLGVNLQAC